ncbi:MAG: LamG domain-containing protein [Candidatus Woesearchaeota archaeon]
MKRKQFTGISTIIMFILLAFSISSAETNIGYEYTDNFLHTWNQNPLGEAESNIWQNISSDYTQFFNGANLTDARERSTWLTNEFGLGYYQNTNFNWLSQNHLSNFTNIIESDNQTYWNQSIYKCKSNNNQEYCAGWIRGQKLNDKYMENSFTWWAPNQFNTNIPIYYVWKLKDINIENNNDYDKVYYCNIQNIGNDTNPYYDRICSSFTLDNKDSFEILNLTDFIEIRDKESERGHIIKWNDTTNMRLRYEGDGNILLLLQIKNINTQDKVELYWIDAGPISCTSGDGIICVDDDYEVSGYINGQKSNYTAFNNTDPRTGRDRRSPLTEWRAYFAFNLNDSNIPKDAYNFTIRIWNGLTEYSPENDGPSDWKTKIYTCGDDCVADGSGLEGGATGGDWADGNYSGIEINWDEEPTNCIANNPCETYITIANSTIGSDVIKQFNLSLQNDRWFHVIYWDNSDYLSDQHWYSNWDISGADGDSTIRNLLNITYTLPPTDNETEAREAISEGINNIIPTSIEYQDKQIYTVGLDRANTIGSFDAVAVLNNQDWAFNYITSNESYTNVNPLLNILNVLENENLNYNQIVSGTETSIKDNIMYGSSLSFNGINDYINTTHSGSLGLSDKITFEARVKFNMVGEQTLLMKNNNYGIRVLPTSIIVNLWNSTDGSHYIIVNESQESDIWKYYAFTWDDTEDIVRIYIDGEEVGNDTFYGPLQVTSNNLLMGMVSWGPPSYYLNGTLDEVRIWNKSLTQTELQQNMNGELTGNEQYLVTYWKFNEASGSMIYDSTSNNNNGTIFGSEWVYE